MLSAVSVRVPVPSLARLPPALPSTLAKVTLWPLVSIETSCPGVLLMRLE